MIAHLRGRLLSKTPNQTILECAGVGYDVTISVTTFSALPSEGAEAALHIHTHVREDQIALFGFSETQEKRLFEKLLTISGIGPKLAITVLSGISSDRLVTAIRSGDHATLTRIPGIGKKTSERVVLELKDKLDDLAVAIPITAGGPHHGPAGDDALSALVNLGYARPVALKAIETAIEKNPEAAHDFELLFRSEFDGAYHHVFTTNSPRITIQKPRFFDQNLQNPQQKRHFAPSKKNPKEDPETVLRSQGHRSAGGP
jgi:Holliday junction DNA helicase RuvA